MEVYLIYGERPSGKDSAELGWQESEAKTRLGVKTVRVKYPEDCGNAPRKLLLKELNIDFAQGKAKPVLDLMTEEVVLDIVGDKRVVGKEALRIEIEAIDPSDRAELHIHNIITHGAAASLNATITMHDGRRIHFCDVYEFTGAGKAAKIRQITSYCTDS